LTGLFAITGMPPSGIFFTKLLILSAGIQTHPIVTASALLLLALVFVGFIKNVIVMMFGEKPDMITSGEKKKLLPISPMVLLTIALYLSFHIPSFLKVLLTETISHY
jgi:hydrogenase-4 component F